MATITFEGKDYFSDPGPLIIPVCVAAGGERHGMIEHIVKVVPELGNAFRSARRAGHLVAGGSFTVHLGNKILILMGLAIGPGKGPSAISALASIAERLKESRLCEVALHVPSPKALEIAQKAIEGWPAETRVRIYHPDWEPEKV